MTNDQRAKMLIPMSGATMDAKWRAAWELLDELPNVEPWNRAAACCWLIYRGIEGSIQHDEMILRVLPHRTQNIPDGHSLAARWTTSLKAAFFYWCFLKDRMIDAAGALEGLNSCKWRDSHPPAVLSHLRTRCIMAYHAFTHGECEVSKSIIRQSIATWQRVMADIDWTIHPLRFMDGKNDMLALHAMMCISARMGTVPDYMRHHEQAIQDLNEPWVLCMKKLRDKPGAVWK